MNNQKVFKTLIFFLLNFITKVKGAPPGRGGMGPYQVNYQMFPDQIHAIQPQFNSNNLHPLQLPFYQYHYVQTCAWIRIWIQISGCLRISVCIRRKYPDIDIEIRVHAQVLCFYGQSGKLCNFLIEPTLTWAHNELGTYRKD
uniref:Uncharacterized protein n=1 Tax=Meloidogyne incognita TaxID=6306 RepID=A0A914KXX6_MELIC